MIMIFLRFKTEKYFLILSCITKISLRYQNISYQTNDIISWYFDKPQSCTLVSSQQIAKACRVSSDSFVWKQVRSFGGRPWHLSLNFKKPNTIVQLSMLEEQSCERILLFLKCEWTSENRCTGLMDFIFFRKLLSTFIFT